MGRIWQRRVNLDIEEAEVTTGNAYKKRPRLNIVFKVSIHFGDGTQISCSYERNI